MSNFIEVVRLGKDAETKYTQSGQSVTSFSAAYDVGFGERKRTTWVRVQVWGKRGESVAPYLLKGVQVKVSGDICTREYEGKTYVEVLDADVKLIGKASSGDNAQPNRGGGGHVQAQRTNEAPDQFEDDAIPFATCVELP